MRAARPIARVVAVASMAVFVGVAVNQVLNGGVWNWWALAISLVLAVLAEVLDRRLGRDDRVRPRLWPALTHPDGSPRRLSEVTPRDLGVHPNRFGAEGEALYVPRDVDDTLDEALAGEDRRVIVVAGPRLAGTTSTLAQAVQTGLPDHRVLGFVDDPRVRLTDLIDRCRPWAGQDPGAVLWLDGLTPDRFTELSLLAPDRLPGGLWVVATVDIDELEGLRIPEPQVKALERHAVRVDLGVLTGTERAELAAAELYGALRPVLDEGTDVLMGRLMVGWDQIRKALTRTNEESTDRVALLRAATDWYRARLPRPLTNDILTYLYQAYRREPAGQGPAAPVSLPAYTRALEWATASGPDRPRLIDVQAVADGPRYASHPLLSVIADDESEPVHWPVHKALWAYADRFFDRDQRRDIGYTALRLRAYPAAGRLLSHDDTTTDAGVLTFIAGRLIEAGDADGAARCYERVAATGDGDQAPIAMGDLGVLEERRGNPDRAREWYRRAIATGHPDHAPRAMLYLGILERQQGDLDQARTWYRRTAATDHPDHAPTAMLNLGVLEQAQGNLDQARDWWRRTSATDHPDQAPRAMVYLGVVAERDDHDQARTWYRRAIATGHPDHAPRAMGNLGVLELQQGDLDQARDLFRQAVATGHPDHAPGPMINLAALEDDQGNVDQARDLYRQAIATGHPDHAPNAMSNLGVLEGRQGEHERARDLLRQAIATRHPDHAIRATVNLGNLEERQGDHDRARDLYLRVIATRHPDYAPSAMVNLGALLGGRGDEDQARRWWQKAAATGHGEHSPWAMLNLGVLEGRRGDADQARAWYRQAIALGPGKAAEQAASLLRKLDRQELDHHRASWFGRFGWRAYADRSLMRRRDRDSDDAGRGDDG